MVLCKFLSVQAIASCLGHNIKCHKRFLEVTFLGSTVSSCDAL